MMDSTSEPRDLPFFPELLLSDILDTEMRNATNRPTCYPPEMSVQILG